MSGPAVPVHCKCGWSGWRVPAKIKSRPCPNCDGQVARWRGLERAESARRELTGNVDRRPWPGEAAVEVYGTRFLAPHQYDLEEEIAVRNEPVPRLPNPYYMPIATGGVQIFRIPAHCRRRGKTNRRR